MSTKTETELIDGAGGARSEPGGRAQRAAGGARSPQGRLRSGCRGSFVIVLLMR